MTGDDEVIVLGSTTILSSCDDANSTRAPFTIIDFNNKEQMKALEIQGSRRGSAYAPMDSNILLRYPLANTCCGDMNAAATHMLSFLGISEDLRTHACPHVGHTGQISLSKRDFDCLQYGEFLNDKIIDLWMHW